MQPGQPQFQSNQPQPYPPQMPQPQPQQPQPYQQPTGLASIFDGAPLVNQASVARVAGVTVFSY